MGVAGQGSACEAGGMPAEGVRWYLMFPISYRDLELMLLFTMQRIDQRYVAMLVQGLSMSG